MQAELEMWWPWFDSLADDEVLHCLPANRPRPRDRECLRDRASQDLPCGHASATVVADSAAAPRRDLLWLWVSFYLCVHCLMQRGTGIGWVMLSLLSCYLIAWGAPEWSGSGRCACSRHVSYRPVCTKAGGAKAWQMISLPVPQPRIIWRGNWNHAGRVARRIAFW